MHEPDSRLTRGAIALVALCHEYCLTIDSAGECSDAADFTRRLLGLLPRIYITAFDLPYAPEEAEDISGILDEEQYAGVCSSVARIYGEHDTYLDALHEDMPTSIRRSTTLRAPSRSYRPTQSTEPWPTCACASATTGAPRSAPLSACSTTSIRRAS